MRTYLTTLFAICLSLMLLGSAPSPAKGSVPPLGEEQEYQALQNYVNWLQSRRNKKATAQQRQSFHGQISTRAQNARGKINDRHVSRVDKHFEANRDALKREHSKIRDSNDTVVERVHQSKDHEISELMIQHGEDMAMLDTELSQLRTEAEREAEYEQEAVNQEMLPAIAATKDSIDRQWQVMRKKVTRNVNRRLARKGMRKNRKLSRRLTRRLIVKVRPRWGARPRMQMLVTRYERLDASRYDQLQKTEADLDIALQRADEDIDRRRHSTNLRVEQAVAEVELTRKEELANAKDELNRQLSEATSQADGDWQSTDDDLLSVHGSELSAITNLVEYGRSLISNMPR